MSVIGDSSTSFVKREIICKICNRSFKRGKDLKSHSVIHNDAKPFACSHCPEAFKHKTSLKRHSLIHTGEKPFACRVCGKSFRQKGSLNEHSLTHSGVKPHTCEVCNMGFTTRSNYARHLRKHLLSKPYVCNICHKEFTVRAYLTRHYSKHKDVDETVSSLKAEDDELKVDDELSPNEFVEKITEVTDYASNKKNVCKLCNEQFKDFKDLRVHLLSHVNKKMYACDICICSFTSIGAYCKHKFAHSQEVFSTGGLFKLNENNKRDSSEKIADIKIYSEDKECVPQHPIPIQLFKSDITTDVSESSENEEFVTQDPDHLEYDMTEVRKNNGINQQSPKNLKLHVTNMVADVIGDDNKQLKINILSNVATNVKNECPEKISLDKIYICKVCNKTFLKEFQFMHHSVIHKNPGPYYCDICGENMEFENLQELHRHYTEHGEVACICYNCNEYSDVYDAKYSKGTVSKCDICYKCFPDKYLLKVHSPTHKNKRPLLIKLESNV